MTHTIIIEKLFQLAVVSILLERALAFVFEIRFSGPRLDARAERPRGPMLAEMLGGTAKAAIAVGTAWAVCRTFEFEVLTAVFQGVERAGAPDEVNVLLTALIVAGGSAGSIKLFQDVLGLGKVARDASREAREAEAELRSLEARAKASELAARIAAAEANELMNLADVESLRRDADADP